MIIGTAWLVRRVRRRTGSHPTSSARPYLLVLVVVATVSFAVSLVATHVAAAVAFFSLPTRAWELAVGGLVALTVNRWRRLSPVLAAVAGWAGLGVILLACTRLDGATPYPGTAALLPVLSTALVIGAGCAAPARGVGRVLALPPMQAVGRVSYSWYLWHWPLALLAKPLGLAGSLAGVLISGGLAVLTLRLIENPLRFSAPVRRSAARSLALVVPSPRQRFVSAWRRWFWCPSRSDTGRRLEHSMITAAPLPRRAETRPVRRGGPARICSGAGRGHRIRRPEGRPSNKLRINRLEDHGWMFVLPPPSTKRGVEVRRYGLQVGGCGHRGLHLSKCVLHRRVVRVDVAARGQRREQ